MLVLARWSLQIKSTRMIELDGLQWRSKMIWNTTKAPLSHGHPALLTHIQGMAADCFRYSRSLFYCQSAHAVWKMCKIPCISVLLSLVLTLVLSSLKKTFVDILASQSYRFLIIPSQAKTRVAAFGWPTTTQSGRMDTCFGVNTTP